MYTVLKLAELRWTGHVTRMSDERLLKKKGKRAKCGMKKRYKDTLKASLKDFDIPMGSWEQPAQERSMWRGLTNKRADLYEKTESVKLKESAENANTNGPSDDFMIFTHSFATDSLELEFA